MERDPMVSFRMPADLLVVVDERAVQELMSRSQWLRELVGIVVSGGVTLDELLERQRAAAQPVVRPVVRSGTGLGESRVTVPGRCLHPVHLVREYATYRRCSCGRKWQL